ncbi:MAG: formate dehydrogenase accessory sulfurtransferase FdhD [Firmicutes bacterium]|nr:formate dehydrogenase accessory sulfurtransferase FdhD [Bacillota bacterium]
MDLTKEFEIKRVENGTSHNVMDSVIVEHEFSLYVNDQLYTELLCSPANLEPLVYGYLYAQGIIKKKDDLLSLSIDHNQAEILLEQGNYTDDVQNSNNTSSELILQAEEIFDAVNRFNSQSSLFASTGGVHSAALCHCDGRTVFMEDIGRHNAVDKAIGQGLLEGWDLSRCFLITSGRVPKELVTKALNTGLRIIISRSAPTDQAVELARKKGITLCGFVRGSRMNVYSTPQRID